MRYPLEEKLAKHNKKQFHLKQYLKKTEKQVRDQKREIAEKLDKKKEITLGEFSEYDKNLSKLHKLRSKLSKNLGKIKELEKEIKKVKKNLTK